MGGGMVGLSEVRQWSPSNPVHLQRNDVINGIPLQTHLTRDTSLGACQKHLNHIFYFTVAGGESAAKLAVVQDIKKGTTVRENARVAKPPLVLQL